MTRALTRTLASFLIGSSLFVGVCCGSENQSAAASSDSRARSESEQDAESREGNAPAEKAAAVTFRGSLDRSRERFIKNKRGCVAFLGGSITEMDGYRPMVMESLRERFPDTEFDFINAGIASTCSHSGAFRLENDVLSHRPDLLLVEFAVNDDQDAAHDLAAARRGMEGVIRNAKQQLPEIDIVMVHFVNPGMLQSVQQNKTPTSIAAHDSVANHYGISTCNVAVELASQIDSGRTSWKVYGGVHPKPAGNRIAANLVEQVFDHFGYAEARSGISSQTQTPPETRPSDDQIPKAQMPKALDAASFSDGRFLPSSAVTLGEGWTTGKPDWKSIPGAMRNRFVPLSMSFADAPGAEASVRFQGTAAGLFVLAGPDAGMVEYSIDDGPWKTRDLYHRHSRGLHYPRTVVLESELPKGQHHLRIRVSASNNEASRGNAVRVLQFVAS